MGDPGAETVERARRGDEAAFAALWRYFQPRVLRYLRVRLAGGVEDVASQVWIDVAGSIARFDGDVDDFRRWLFTIAHRRSVDEVRRAIRRQENLVADLTDHAFDRGADAVFDDGAALERALTLVGALPAATAEAIALRVIAGLTVAETAEVMGRTAGSVRVLVHRGLRRLAADLKGSEEDSARCVTRAGGSTMSPVT